MIIDEKSQISSDEETVADHGSNSGSSSSSSSSSSNSSSSSKSEPIIAAKSLEAFKANSALLDTLIANAGNYLVEKKSKKYEYLFLSRMITHCWHVVLADPN